MSRTPKLFTVLAVLQVFFALASYPISRVGLRAWSRTHPGASMPGAGEAARLVGAYGLWLVVVPPAFWLFCFLRTKPEMVGQTNSPARMRLAIGITAALALIFSWVALSAVFLALIEIR